MIPGSTFKVEKKNEKSMPILTEAIGGLVPQLPTEADKGVFNSGKFECAIQLYQPHNGTTDELLDYGMYTANYSPEFHFNSCANGIPERKD